MALSIHTNYSALITNTALNKSNNALATNQQRLGTGLRINSAADDAAGLQIATRLNAQTRGMAVAMRNTNDAVSMLQTAEGAFSETTDILQRMKDLSTQAANDTNTAADRTAMQAEFDALGEELNNIFSNTKYAGEALFTDKLADAVNFQIGASADETMAFDVSTNMGTLETTLTTTVQALTLDTAANAGAAITALEKALDEVGAMRAEFGATI